MAPRLGTDLDDVQIVTGAGISELVAQLSSGIGRSLDCYLDARARHP